MAPSLPVSAADALHVAEQVPWPFVMAFGSLLIIYVLFRRRADVFRRLAFTHREVAIICLGSIAGWAVNVPVLPMGAGYLAVNLGGALIPLILVALWWRRGKLPVKRSLVGVLVVSAIAYAITRFDPAHGVIAVFPWFFLPSVAALGYALMVTHRALLESVPVAYASGSLGALLGADVYRLPAIVGHFSAPGSHVTVVSIGGAGVFDMVFLAGALAMATDLVVVSLAVAHDETPPDAYGGRAFEVGPSGATWDAYRRLPDPNALERATAALALSDLALTRREHARTVRMAFLAVDAVLKAGSPPLLRQLSSNGAADPRLVQDLRALAQAYQASKEAAPTRTGAGNANTAAKLLVGALAPRLGLPSRLEAP